MPKTATGFVVMALSALAMFMIGAALYTKLKPYLPAFITGTVGV